MDVWALRSESTRSFDLSLHTALDGHDDIVRDVVVVAKVRPFSCIPSFPRPALAPPSSLPRPSLVPLLSLPADPAG